LREYLKEDKVGEDLIGLTGYGNKYQTERAVEQKARKPKLLLVGKR